MFNTFIENLDPSDYKEYQIDFTLLEEDEEIKPDFTISLDEESESLGIEIETTLKAPVRVNQNKGVQFWIKVDPDFQEDSTFSEKHFAFIKCRINTTKSRIYERTARLIVRQL